MVDPAHVRHLAALARLSLTEEEVAALTVEAEAVLRMFDSLPVEAAGAVGATGEGGGRPDVAETAPQDVVEAILSQVPRRDGARILVPRGGES